MAKASKRDGLEFIATLNAAEFNRLLEELRSNTGRTAKEINALLGGTVTKTVKLETVTDANGAKVLVAAEKERLSVVDRIIAEQNKLNRIQQGSVTSLRQQLNQAKQARDEISKFKQDFGGISNRLNNINEKWTVQNQRVQDIQRQLAKAEASGFWAKLKAEFNLGGLSNFSSGLVALTQGFQSASIIIGQFTGAVNTSVEAVANLQQFALTFKAIGQGAAGGVQALQESSRIALNLGTNINTVREGFQQLSPVVLNSGGTIQDVSNIVESLSSRFAAFGISGDKARRVTNGVIQAFAKGKLQAEELTQQISEADPAFKTDFARAVGVSVQELERLVKAGKITSSVLIQKIPLINKTALLYGKLGSSATDAVNALAGGQVTIDQVRNKLASLSQLNLETFAKSIQPILVGFLRIQAVVVDFITNIGKLEATKTLGIVFGEVAKQVGFLVESFIRISEAVLIAITPIAKIINFLLQIPGVSQIIGLAILSKVVEPLGKAAAAFKAAALASVKFNSAISASSSGTMNRFGSMWTGLNQSILNVGKNLTTTATSSRKATKDLSTRFETYTRLVGSAENNLEKLRTKLDQLKRIQIGGLGGNVGPLIDATSSKISRYEKLIASTKLKTQAIGIELQSTGNKFNFLGNAARATGNAIVGTVGAAVTSIRSIASALGPVGIAFAALSVLIAALRDGTASYNAEIEKSRGTIEALQASTKELSGSSSQSLGGFALLWTNFSLTIGEVGRKVIEVIDKISNQVNILSDSFSKASGAGTAKFATLLTVLGSAGLGFLVQGPVGAVIGGIAAAIVVLAAAGDAGSASMRRLKQEFEGARDAIAKQSLATQDLGNALIEQASKAKDSSFALQKLLPQYNQFNSSVEELRSRQKQLKTSLDASERAFKNQEKRVNALNILNKKLDAGRPKNVPFGQGKTETLEEFEKRKKNLENERAKSESLKKTNEDIRRTYEEITKTVGDLGKVEAQVSEKFKSLFKVEGDPGLPIAKLNESLKEANQNLESAVPNSKAFVSAISQISSLEYGLKKLRTLASDPITIVNANVQRLQELNQEISKLEKDKKIEVDAKIKGDIDKDLKKLQQEKKLLAESDSEIRLQIKIKDLEFQNEINRIVNKTKLAISNIGLFDQGTILFGKNAVAEASKIGGTVFKAFGANRTFEDFITLGIGIDPEEVRQVKAEIFAIQDEIQSSTEKIAVIDKKLLSQGLGATERKALLQEKAKFVADLGLSIAEGTLKIADAGVKLRNEIAGIRQDILGLKLRNLNLLPPEQRQNTLDELQRQVQEIVNRKNLKVTFFGTPEEIIRQKQEFVDFYNTLDQKNTELANKQSALNEIEAAALRISQIPVAAQIEKFLNSVSQTVDPMASIDSFAGSLALNMETAAAQALTLKRIIESTKLPKPGSAFFIPPPGRWAGGPVSADTTYRVNELGKEGFLNRSGDISAINRPRNALWRPPSSGTVIPAHIMAGLVSNGVRANTPTAGINRSAGRSSGASSIAGSNNNLSASIRTLSNAQARQAVELSKLSTAVRELSDSDWNVNVLVNQRNDGGLHQSRVSRSLR